MTPTTARQSKENAGQNATKMPARQSAQRARRHTMSRAREPESLVALSAV